MPAARTPAQIEAARRNGARSRGPVSAEGKARSRLNALRHGLAAAEHLLVEGEDPAAYDDLLRCLVEEHEPATESDIRVVQRLASAIWRELRADRLEAKLFASAPRPRLIGPNGFEHADPETTFDLSRLDGIRRYRADASREAARLRRELRGLSREWTANDSTEELNEPAVSCHPPARPGGQGAGTSSEGPERSPAPDGPVKPGHDNDAEGARQGRQRPEPACPEPSFDRCLAPRNEPGPARTPNRQARRRLAALARTASRRAA